MHGNPQNSAITYTKQYNYPPKPHQTSKLKELFQNFQPNPSENQANSPKQTYKVENPFQNYTLSINFPAEFHHPNFEDRTNLKTIDKQRHRSSSEANPISNTYKHQKQEGNTKNQSNRTGTTNSGER